MYSKVEKEALLSVTSLFGRKRKRQEYIDQRLDAYLKEEIQRWEVAKQKFTEKEQDKEINENKSHQMDYDAWIEEFCLTFNPTKEYLSKKLEQLLAQIDLPVEFSVSFALFDKGTKIYLDIDLPEIEDYPQKKSTTLATGKISVKNKSVKEKNLSI